MMICVGCKQEAYHIHGEFVDGEYVECCEQCGRVSSSDAPVTDVYWPGHEHTNPQLCDSMGVPYQLTSKAQKARVMKMLNVTEAGDRVGGARYAGQGNWTESTRAYRKKQFEKDKPLIRKAYKEWKERQR